MQYDLLLKGGMVIDSAQGIHAIKDIAFKGGIVAEAGDDLDPSSAREVIDCSGSIVSPGWIDLHIHAFWGCSHFGIDPDPHLIANGVTTALDAGSAGADTFPGFRRFIIEKSDTSLFAYLHISSQGMLSKEIGELKYMEYASVEKAVKRVNQNRDVILGIKVRLAQNLIDPSAGIEPLHLAREAADAVGLPLMVHPNDAACDSINDILAVMKKNDILTHCFQGDGCGILDEDDKIRESVREARQRGVLFDVGHGMASFKWQVAEHAIAQGFYPDTISSDLHIYNVDGPVFDMATTMGKFIYLGLALEDVLAKVTAYPARVLGMPDQIGTLKKGAVGDAVVFKMETGSFDFVDANGQLRTGSQRPVPTTVIRSGKVYH